MQINIRGILIDLELPKSVREAEERIDELKVVATHLQNLPERERKRQGRKLSEINAELQVLKNWRKNANAQMQLALANSGIVNAAELNTETGLIRHLHNTILRLARIHTIDLSNDERVVLGAANHWLRNSQVAVPMPEQLLDYNLQSAIVGNRTDGEPELEIPRGKTVYREWGDDEKRETVVAMSILNQRRNRLRA